MQDGTLPKPTDESVEISKIPFLCSRSLHMSSCVICYIKKAGVIVLTITVVQPPYFMGERPDETIAQFLMNEMDQVKEGALIVLPEYSNAGGMIRNDDFINNGLCPEIFR